MIVVTAAFPFVPAELNIAHAASTYVPADVYARLLKICSVQAVLVSATDYHSIYASKDGRYVDEDLCDRFDEKYRDYFCLLHIHFDKYIRTNEIPHEKLVTEIFQVLFEKEKIYRSEDQDVICEECCAYLPNHMVVEKEDKKKHCYFCGSTKLETKKNPHYFLKAAGEEQYICHLAKQQPQKEVRNMICSYAESGLKDWNISRYNHLGVALPEDTNQSIYIWFDSLIAYLSLIGNEYKDVNETVHFIGKNIVYYHSVIWPLIARDGFSEKLKITVSARGFLDFVHTEDSMISVEQLCGQYNSDFLRFYLLFKVKDNISDYRFEFDDFKKICSFYCGKKLGGYFYTVWKMLNHSLETDGFDLDSEKEDMLLEKEKKWMQFRDKLQVLMRRQEIHQVLRILLDYVDEERRWCKTLTTMEMKKEKIQCDLKVNAARVVCLIAAYMPVLAKEYSIFDDWVPDTLEEAGSADMHKLKKEKEIVRF